jgi:hypothetical protein
MNLFNSFLGNHPGNDLWFFLSTSGIYLACAMALISFGVIGYIRNRYTNLLHFISGVIAVIFALLLVALFSYYILSKIPDLGNNWTWNYLLNFISQIVIAGGVLLVLLALGRRTLKLRAQQAQA